MKNNISAESGEELSAQELELILRNIQEQYSGAARAELASRKKVLNDRLTNAQVNNFQAGVLEELVGESARIDGVMSVRQGLLSKQQAEQEEYEQHFESIVEGDDCLDKSPTTANPSHDRFTPPAQPLLIPPLNETEAKIIEFVRQMIATDRTNL